MSDRVTVRIDGGVADVRLNRPDKLNASTVTCSSRWSTPGPPRRDTSVRAVVLSGEGRSFSAGLDFSGFMAMAGGGQSARRRRRREGRHHGRHRAPTGASPTWPSRPPRLVRGAGAGHRRHPGPLPGRRPADRLGADLRIVHPEATLSVLEIRWGLSPDMTGTATLPRLVGPTWPRS